MMGYADHEQEFLAAIATKFGFLQAHDRFYFVQRHLEGNADLTHEGFADMFEGDLRKEGVRAEDLYQWVRDRLSKTIRPTLEKHGFKLPEVGRYRLWDAVREWLKTDKYPQWLNQKLWRKLWQKGEFTDKIYPEPCEPQLATLAPRTPRQKKSTQMVAGTEFVYRVEESLKGYLLWLERDSEGGIYCYSPSCLTPHPFLDGKPFSLPQSDSRDPVLVIGDELGEEQVLVITVPSRPSWDWLPDEQGDIFQLEPQHLDVLLDQVRLAGVQMKRACYEVVAAEPKQ